MGRCVQAREWGGKERRRAMGEEGWASEEVVSVGMQVRD